MLKAQDIWPAAGQIAYKIFGRDRSNIWRCEGRIFDRSPPWTALAGTYDHQNGHRYRLRPFMFVRRHRSNWPTSAEASRVDSPAKQLLKLALSQDTAWQAFAIACSNL